MFDSDDSGTISRHEIRAALQSTSLLSEEVLEQIIKEVDENSDGEISFLEFKQIMNNSI